MLVKVIAGLVIIFTFAFVAYRFGLIGKITPTNEPADEITLTPTPIQLQQVRTAIPSATPNVATTSAKIIILEAPIEASASRFFTVKWYIDNNKSATTSHTAIHFGKTSKPYAKLPSDYPEKSSIQSGTIPATFSAQLKIDIADLYYFRVHAIIDNLNIWSEEKTIMLNDVLP